MWTNSDRGRGFSCKRTPFSEVSLIRGEGIHVFCRNLLLFHIFLPLLKCPPTQCPHGQGRGIVKEKADRCGQGEGGAENSQKCADILYG